MIEPTAQIIVRQNSVDQRRLPDEDAKSLVFDDTLLFDIDKFSGYDRFETGTRANVGVQYTFQANNGIYARAVFGQSFHLAGENPYVDPGLGSRPAAFNYSPVSGLETNRSDYVAGLYLSPFTGMSLITQSRFDEKDWSLRRQDTSVHGQLRPRSRASLAYTFTHFDPVTGLLDNQQEIMATLGLQLTNHWSVLGTMRYDIDAQQRIQDLLSAEVRRRMLRADGQLHRDLRRERGARSEARPHGDAALRAQASRRVQLPDRPAEPRLRRPEPGAEAVSAH